MGSKRKVTVCIVLVFLISIFFTVMYITPLQKEENYNAILISVLNKREKAMVQDIFSFKFERAYIFNDCYISGEGFAKRYNLDISINQIESGVSENIQRIVFVNESGVLVYEFKCNTSEVIIPEKGMVIYPETVIERESPIQKKPLTIRFQSSEYYDSQ